MDVSTPAVAARQLEHHMPAVGLLRRFVGLHFSEPPSQIRWKTKEKRRRHTVVVCCVDAARK
jgi:hypothetical protein